jgi:hypothetical protein
VVCFWYIFVNTLHQGDNDGGDDDDNNKQNIFLAPIFITYSKNCKYRIDATL